MFSVPDWDDGAAPSVVFNFGKKKVKKTHDANPENDVGKPKLKNANGKTESDKTNKKSANKSAKAKPVAGQFVRPLNGSSNTPAKKGKRKHEESNTKTPASKQNTQQSPSKKRKLDKPRAEEKAHKLKGPFVIKSPNTSSNEHSPKKEGKLKKRSNQNQSDVKKPFAKKIPTKETTKNENTFAKKLPPKPAAKKAKPAKKIELAEVESDTELSAEVNKFRKELMKGYTGPRESEGTEAIVFSDADDLDFTDSDDEPKPKRNAFGDSKTNDAKKSKKTVVELANDDEEAPPLVPIDSFRNKLIGNLKGSRFRFLNELMYTSEGSNSMKLFKDDRGAFAAYHDGYRQQVQQWPLNPLDRIIKSIKKMPKTFVIADFGCGEGRLAKAVPQKTYSLDLVAHRHEIIACDMAHTPLETNSIDVAVYCLSLMGTNLKDFLLEANRVMKMNGTLKIAEVESRFDDVRKFIENVKSCGYQHVNTDSSSKFFVFINFKKVRNVEKGNKQVPAFSLKPCLYKKR